MKTVITMTSWTKRIQYVGKAIYRFLKTQTIKPDIFYLWLAEEEFPKKEKDLPDDLLIICSAFNIQIKWTKDNEYCFKRWYVFPEHNDDMVISIDDDMFYDPKTIETVLNVYKANPIPAIIHYHGGGGEIIIKNDIEYFITNIYKGPSSKNYFIGQCAFTPHSFPLNSLTEDAIKIRKNICPKCDESWMHPFIIKNNIPIIFIRNLQHHEEYEKQNVAIKIDLHFNKVKIGNKMYKKADLYKQRVLNKCKDLQESWHKAFPNYKFNFIEW